MSAILEGAAGRGGPDLHRMFRHDPARVLRDYSLEPLRQELRRLGNVLSVTSTSDVGRELVAEGSCAGAWVDLEDVEGLDLAALSAGVTRALRVGGRLSCVVPGRSGFAAFRRAFEPAIAWQRSTAFGVLVPSSAAWPRTQPLLLALLATAEHVTRRWPGVRALGAWVLHEGVRR